MTGPERVTGPERQDEQSMWDLATLAETSALLDRLGGRRPSPDDLDDPLAAALAVFAADVDLDAVRLATTRRAVVAAGLLPAAHLRTEVDWFTVDTSAQTRRAFRDGSVHSELAHSDPAELPALLPAMAYGFVSPADAVPDAPAPMRLRALPVLAATASAVLLSMGAAAAVSGGQTVNPAQVVRGIVAEVRGGNPGQTSPGARLGGVSGADRGGSTATQRPARGAAVVTVTRGGGVHTGPEVVPTLGPQVPPLGQVRPADGAAAPSGPFPDASEQPVLTDPLPADPLPAASDQVTADPTGAPSSWAPEPSPTPEATRSSRTSSSSRHGSTSHSPRENSSTQAPQPTPSHSRGHD